KSNIARRGSDEYDNSAANDNQPREVCSSPRRPPPPIRGPMVAHLATDRYLLARVGPWDAHWVSDRFTNGRPDRRRRATQRDRRRASAHLVPGIYGSVHGIAYVPIFCRLEL